MGLMALGFALAFKVLGTSGQEARGHPTFQRLPPARASLPGTAVTAYIKALLLQETNKEKTRNPIS